MRRVDGEVSVSLSWEAELDIGRSFAGLASLHTDPRTRGQLRTLHCGSRVKSGVAMPSSFGHGLDMRQRERDAGGPHPQRALRFEAPLFVPKGRQGGEGVDHCSSDDELDGASL